MFSIGPAARSAALAALLAIPAATSAQGSPSGYLVDTRGAVVKDAFNLCWRTGYWAPAMAVAECDPDLVPKAPPAPAPAPRQATPAPKPAAPAPAPAPAAKPAAKPAAAAPRRCDATVTLQADELFAFNKATLSKAALARLDKDVLARMAACATVEAVVVTGHTDRLGSQQYNQKLSAKRADAVKAYLVRKGVVANKVETLGMGKTAPAKFCPDGKSRNELIACLAPNRRVEVLVKGPGK